jgi:hypothetical protein
MRTNPAEGSPNGDMSGSESGKTEILTANRTNFHEWGAASPEMFVFGLIRVNSSHSWVKNIPSFTDRG